ncbi:MAG: hypothetical protein AB1546_00905 [bacterium]
MATVQPVTSVRSIPPGATRYAVRTSQKVLPPKTPRVRTMPQRPPAAPQTRRVPTLIGNRVDLKI